jgi:hypothetical protein
MMRIYYWPEMDQLCMVYINNDYAICSVQLSAGKNGWYETAFPGTVLFNILNDGEIIFSGFKGDYNYEG